MKKFFLSILFTVIFLPQSINAGPRLNNYTTYKDFAIGHQSVAYALLKNMQQFEGHKIVMVYPEKEKKSMRLEQLGLSYTKGDLYFLEFPQKDDGVYVSFNGEGFLDAVVIEVSKSRQGAIMFTWNEFSNSMLGMKVLPSSKINQDDIIDVINGQKSYIDIHCTNEQKESFYVRVKDVHISSNPFYRIALYRL